jgi:hypothetical protein
MTQLPVGIAQDGQQRLDETTFPGAADGPAHEDRRQAQLRLGARPDVPRSW